MDFFRLAIREAKRNSTRTLVAIIATALSAAALVISHLIPHGYPEGLFVPQRRFVGGEIVVFSGVRPVVAGESGTLEWEAWRGSDWQSIILHYFPQIESQGYFRETGSPGWRSFSLDQVRERLEGIDNIAQIFAYRSIPCVVKCGDREYPAILRARDFDTDNDLHSISESLVEGRLPRDHADRLEAIIPLRSDFCDKLHSGGTARVVVPKPVMGREGASLASFRGGFDFDSGMIVSFTIAGTYAIQLGQVEDRANPVQAPDGRIEFPLIPVYWERPEIIIDDETFDAVLAQVSGIAFNEVQHLPTYQVVIRVHRTALLKRTTEQIRSALPDLAVYSIPELESAKSGDLAVFVVSRHAGDVLVPLTFCLSSMIVAGSVYIILAQQRRKIGLFRVVGARKRDIMTYTLGLVGYVTATGTLIGYAFGKAISLFSLIGNKISFAEWAIQACNDLIAVLAMGMTISLCLGFIVGVWASTIPCAEVLKRE